MAEDQSFEPDAGALVAAQDSFDTLFENAPVMLHSIDEGGKLLKVNRSWTETLGYEKDEVLGHKSTEFLADESRQRATKDTLPLFWPSTTSPRPMRPASLSSTQTEASTTRWINVRKSTTSPPLPGGP